MKNSLIVLALILGSLQASAGEFYQCSGFGGEEENRANIDLEKGTAGFFDNDTTSLLTLTSSRTQNGQRLLVFEGKDAGYAGTLRLVFNATKKSAVITSFDLKGEANPVGHAPCELSTPWE